MTKSVSSKKQHKPSSPKADPVTVRSIKSKKMGSEIDEIFACKKRKRPEKDTKANTGISSSKVSTSTSKNLDSINMVKNVKKKKKPEKDTASSDDRLNSRSKKKTADGLRIYTEEELGFGNPNAGGTSLCPFDCDCCF